MNYHLTSQSIFKALSERRGIALCGQFGRMVMTQALKGLDWSNPSPEAREQRQL
jgi:hypothetical protein